MASIKRPPVFRVSAIQVIALLVVCGGLFFVNIIIALAFLAGGLVAVIPHLYFTAYAFRYMGAKSSRQIAQSFYRGESGKFVLTLVGFSGVFIVLPTINPLALFSGYILMLVLQWWLTARAVASRYQR